MLWTIAKGVLTLLDGFFGVINRIWKYDFFNNEYVGKMLTGAIIVACSWLSLKVLIELIMNFMIKNDGRETPLKVYKGIVIAISLMYLITPLFNFGHQFSTALTEAVISVTGTTQSGNTETMISSSLIKSMINKNETQAEDITYFVNNWKTVDINDTEGGFLGMGDCYKYSINFFMLIILSLITIFLLFFIAIQMSKRVMELALYKIIAPFCCTSLTDSGKPFEIWFRSVMGIFLITAVQFVCIGLLLTIFGSAFEQTGTLTAIFLVVGALLFIITTPTLINTLLNQQSGMMSGFGDMQSLMAISSIGGHTLGLAKAGTMGALSMGANVVKHSGHSIMNGGNKIANMMNKSKVLTPEQKSMVKESINNHNSYKAQNQVNEYLRENRSNYSKPTSNQNINNSFNQISNMKYNPLKDQYTNFKNNNDRK